MYIYDSNNSICRKCILNLILLAAEEDFTSVVSEIMMYILLVFLTLWLLIEMIYCYRKVSKAEEAAQENA